LYERKKDHHALSVNMLFKLASLLPLAAVALSSPFSLEDFHENTRRDNVLVEAWYPTRDLDGLVKRADLETTLANGNLCDVEVSPGSTTGGWNPTDWSNLFSQAGNAMTGSISRNNQAQVSLSISFEDSSSVTHQVDCEVTTGAGATVSVQGAYQNVDQACSAAEDLADSQWTGFIGSASAVLQVYFGTVVALSIQVNVLN
jgi:hypothetical protein